MKVIHKFTLGVTNEQSVTLTDGAQPLCVQVQNGKPQLWVLLDPQEQPIEYTVYTVGTGHNTHHIKETYLGTYQLEGGALVFHVFIY